MKNKLSMLAVAIAAIFPMAQSAHAQSNAELKQEIELLKKQLQVLMQKVDAASAAPAAQATIDPQDFNRIKIKAESTEDSFDAAGLKGFKVSGVIDPTFIYNQSQNRSGFVFLNNFDNTDATNSYAFDNSSFGSAVLDIQKETDGGNKWRLTLAPHKSGGSAYRAGSIVHEASVSVPWIDEKTRVLAGQIPDWSGYEYVPTPASLYHPQVTFAITAGTNTTANKLKTAQANLTITATTTSTTKKTLIAGVVFGAIATITEQAGKVNRAVVNFAIASAITATVNKSSLSDHKIVAYSEVSPALWVDTTGDIFWTATMGDRHNYQATLQDRRRTAILGTRLWSALISNRLWNGQTQ